MKKRVSAKKNNFTPWDEFNPWEYAHRNYGIRMLPEDELIIQTIVEFFREIDLNPKQLTSVADIGAGPNLYPAMLLSPFVKDNGSIVLIECSQANIDYLNKILYSDENNETLSHQQSWERYAQRIEALGGNLYKGNYKRVKKLVKIEKMSVYDVMQEQFDAISSFFVSESITNRYEEFQSALAAIIGSLKPGGIFLIAHMVRSEGYFAGEGTDFPAVSLSLEELRNAYDTLDVDFQDFNVKEVSALKEEDKVREGYHGMAIVTGRVATS